MVFIDRKDELNFLEERYVSGKPEIIVIYGRRRVGKTELIKEFIGGKHALYFSAEKGNIETNLERFIERIAQITNQQGISFKGWVEAFAYLKNQKLVVVIDEFPYLIESDPSIVSTFQRVADEIRHNSQLYLILCGSSVSMMEDKVLAYKSPLYGRRTGQWQLNPMSFKDAKLFYPNYDIQKQMEAYSIAGGIPMYLAEFDDKLSIKENLHKKILSKGNILYEEPKFVLNLEFGESKVYFSILEALAKGKNTVKEISDSISVDSRNVNKYLNLLIRLHYVTKIYPLFYEKNKKKVRYQIKDNFFDFWFKFVNPNFSDLEMGNIENVQSKILLDFNAFVGRKFEYLCEQMLLLLNREKKLPFEFLKIGPFWDKTKDGQVIEIDRLAVNEKEKKLFVVECKWADSISSKKLLTESEEKVKSVALFDKYKINYVFFAKSFKDSTTESNARLFDLKKISEMM